MTMHVSQAFERTVLRRIDGPIQEKGQWRPMWINEMYSLYIGLNIVDNIKVTIAASVV
jgi:hypothetical protein